ncbi:MAG: FAD binding domain-containing protein [Gammaproteobacteria bacterium]|nr:FAD binding domain-containing protein [Pseudomonadales bacterium]MCP5348715.1 FAD binding domain-containing protein [Pseudomonadales bacterium]
MKQFQNLNARSLQEAVDLARQAGTRGQVSAFSGGGTDLLQQVKDGTDPADVLINLRTVEGEDQVTEVAGGIRVGGQITLTELASNEQIRRDYPVLAEAAAVVGTPQIRNVGTLAGNVTQRPWCWYYRNGFNCYKAGGDRCYSVVGENQLHAIFGGGPSYIVHPSDLAPALVALGARFNVIGPEGERSLNADQFFQLPARNPRYENTLARDELLASVVLPTPRPGVVSAYHKVMDRAAWTHAVVSAAAVLELRDGVCNDAVIVLGGVAPIPWPATEAQEVLRGRPVTAELARQAGEVAVSAAQPLSRNAYKVPMTSAVIERLVLALADGQTAV